MEHFADRLVEAIRAKGTPTVVGLDPRFDLLPGEVVKANLGTNGRNAQGWRARWRRSASA